tara:strand:- start:12764 stop:13435 length:672 start_codon:yes stop_codon:yes gene_type:complete
MFFGQVDKYFPNNISRYVFSNEKSDCIPENWQLIQYEDSLSYNKRVASCLKNIKEEYAIFHHEDMPLYAEPDLNFISSKINLMKEDSIDYIKLIKGGNLNFSEKKYKGEKCLYHLPKNGDSYFSVQPCLVKLKSLLKLYENCNINKVHEFEPKAHILSRIMGHKNLYYYNNEPKRGLGHWDSSVYPYVATAIVKGKWNYSEYSKELTELHETYSVDKSIRGEF